jgi:flagellar motility protein MotE (MotC chaperone)
LKIADLALDSGRLFANDDATANDQATSVIRRPPGAPPSGGSVSWAGQMFNFPDGSGAPPAAPAGDFGLSPAERAKADAAAAAADVDITGSIAETPASGTAKPAPAPARGKSVAKPGETTVVQNDLVVAAGGPALPSGAERQLLERLAQRRQELDARARALDIRENLVNEAERRIAAHLAEVKEIEARIKAEIGQKDQAEAARFKALVTMYENMKPRDAAKIFDGLDMEVLIKVVSAINPRAMADIMAQMSPPVAERLTVALATKAQQTTKDGPAELPKIDGHPTGP